MKLLKPLGILHIGFAPWDAFDVACVDEADFDFGFLKEVVERNPVVAGAFHGNGLNVGFEEPRDRLPEIGIKSAERAYGVSIAAFGNGNDNFLGGDVDASGIGMTNLLKLP